MFQYLKQHGARRTFTTGAGYSNCFLTVGNDSKQFRSLNDGNTELFCLCTSATVSSIAVETTIRSVVFVMPLPSCRKQLIPSASSFSLHFIVLTGDEEAVASGYIFPDAFEVLRNSAHATSGYANKKWVLKSSIVAIILQIKYNYGRRIIETDASKRL